MHIEIRKSEGTKDIEVVLFDGEDRKSFGSFPSPKKAREQATKASRQIGCQVFNMVNDGRSAAMRTHVHFGP